MGVRWRPRAGITAPGKALQRGAFALTRAILLSLILMAMLVVPLWLGKENKDKQAAVNKAEVALSTPTGQGAASVATPSTATSTAMEQGTQAVRGIGHGLTFARLANDTPDPTRAESDSIGFGCHGQPAELDRPHSGSCNPYQGDTSCRVVLPVLCLHKDGSPPPKAQAANTGTGASAPGGVTAGAANASATKTWTGGTLGATQAVMGAILESRAMGDARCEKELGSGWRMADFHDGTAGWALHGRRGLGLTGHTRYWVHVQNQPGNCWDSAT